MSLPRRALRRAGAVAAVALAAGLATALPAAATLTNSFNGDVDSTGATAPAFKPNKFTTQDTTTITATLTWTAAAAKLDMTLKDPAGVVVATTKPTTAQPETLTYTPSGGDGLVGTFVLGVKAVSGGATAYSLQVTHSATVTPPSADLSYSASFGYFGHAGVYPYGMAFDPTTNQVVVADVWNYAVKRYSTAGSLLDSYTHYAARGASGGFGAPFGLAVDGEGDVWVADQSNSRIVELSPGDNPSVLLTIQTSFFGCAGGSIPTHLAIDTNPADTTYDDVFVADPRCRTVYAFSHTGQWLSQYSYKFDMAGTGVYTPIPRGLAIDEATHQLLVAEFNSKRIFVFPMTGGTSVASFPAANATDLSDVRGVAYDPTNQVLYAVGAENSDLARFAVDNSSGSAVLSSLQTFGSARADVQVPLDTPRFVTTDPAGNVYVSDLYGYQVWKLSPAGAVESFAPPAPPPDGGLNQNNGIAVDPSNGHLYVVDTFENRVQELRTTVDDTATGASSYCVSAGNCPAWLDQFGHRAPLATDSLDLDYPHAITVGGGYVWMDAPNALLQLAPSRNPDGSASYALVGYWGGHGKGPGEFSNGPQGLRVGPDPANPSALAVWTSDVGNCRIMAVPFSGPLGNVGLTGNAPDASFGTCGNAATQMNGPRQLDVRTDPVTGHPDVYVADTGNSRVDVFDGTTGQPVVTLPTKFAGVSLRQPVGVQLDPSGTWLYIADSGNKRIVRVHPDGTDPEVASVGADTPQGHFGGPEWLAFGPDGRLFVSDNSQTVEAFTVSNNS